MSDVPAKPHICGFNIDIVASLTLKEHLPKELQNVTPVFRFLLWTGQRVTTSDWDSWDVLELPDLAINPSISSVSSNIVKNPGKITPASTGDKGKKVATPALGKKDQAISGCLMRHRTAVHDLVMDEGGAAALGERPLLFLFCTLVEDSAGDAKVVGKGGADKGAKGAPAKSTVASSPSNARPYAFWIPLEVSPLLLPGRLSVACVHGSVDAAIAAAGVSTGAAVQPAQTPLTVSNNCHMDPPSDLMKVFASLLGFPAPTHPLLPTPALFSFLSFSVTLASSKVESLESPTFPLSPPAGASIVPKGVPIVKSPPSGKSTVASVPTPGYISIFPPTLLAPHVRASLNPLSITILRAEALPGVTPPPLSDDTHWSKLTQSSPYSLQTSHCSPIYATLVFPTSPSQRTTPPPHVLTLCDALPHLDSPSSSISQSILKGSLENITSSEVRCGFPMQYPPKRVAFTPAFPAQSTITWDSTCVICTGRDGAWWRQQLESSSLQLRVHDRDVRSMERLVEIAKESSVKGVSKQRQGEQLLQKLSASSATIGNKAAPSNPASITQISSSNNHPTPGDSANAYAILRRILLDVNTWPWPILSSSRTSVFEDMANGTLPWPSLNDGEPLPSMLSSLNVVLSHEVAAASTPSKIPQAGAKGASSLSPSALPASGRDIFDIDTLLISEICARTEHSGATHSHGVSDLRLEGLLNENLGKPSGGGGGGNGVLI